MESRNRGQSRVSSAQHRVTSGQLCVVSGQRRWVSEANPAYGFCAGRSVMHEPMARKRHAFAPAGEGSCDLTASSIALKLRSAR